MDKTYLNDIWNLYFHDNSSNWENESFILITTISNVEDFCAIFKLLDEDNYWYKGMFFIFREGVSPRWEDPNNIKGGCYSYKISTEEIQQKWFDLCCKSLGDTIGVNEEYCLNVNGFSITPKKNANILRILLKDNNLVDPEYYNISISKYSTLLYKKHLKD